MRTLKWLVSASLALVLLPALWAEARCPGNAASIRLRAVGSSLIALPVMIDGTGPYDFVVDTGSQITTIDPQLASGLHLTHIGTAHITGVGFYSQVDYGQLKVLQAGPYSIMQPTVLVENLKQIQPIDPRIRGILGASFLEHFDLLIDYKHHILCLDATKQMQQAVKGERIALLLPPHADEYLPFTLPLIVSTRLSGMSDQRMLLQLDSGIDVPLLFESGTQLTHVQFFGLPLRHKDGDEGVQSFAVLPAQDIEVGDHALRQISFVTPVVAGKFFAGKPDVDGLLPTALFRRAFISYADHFAVLEPR